MVMAATAAIIAVRKKNMNAEANLHPKRGKIEPVTRRSKELRQRREMKYRELNLPSLNSCRSFQSASRPASASQGASLDISKLCQDLNEVITSLF